MSSYTTATFVSLIFLIFKFIEMKIIDKDNKPLKSLVRDTILVYFSTIASLFIIDQFNSDLIDGSSSTTAVFTDTPGF